MYKFSLVYIAACFAALFFSGCNQTNVVKSHDVNSDAVDSVGGNIMWLSDLGICTDSIIDVEAIPNIYSRRGVYLDSVQIQALIADKIPERASSSVSSIRLFSIKGLSDSLFIGVYVYNIPI